MLTRIRFISIFFLILGCSDSNEKPRTNRLEEEDWGEFTEKLIDLKYDAAKGQVIAEIMVSIPCADYFFKLVVADNCAKSIPMICPGEILQKTEGINNECAPNPVLRVFHLDVDSTDGPKRIVLKPKDKEDMEVFVE